MTSALQPQASANNLQTGARVALFGMLVNLIFAAAKILGGLFGHAYVLIADGIESALDIAGSFVIWGGLKVAARPPDETHPYGHGKAEPIAAVVVAFGVLAAAAGLAVESVREILTPHRLELSAMGQNFVITIDTVKWNEDIPKSRFDVPADVQALLPKAGAAK